MEECFGKQAADWQCPICDLKPDQPLVACPGCGCQLLLTIKIRRLHHEWLKQGRTQAASALIRRSP